MMASTVSLEELEGVTESVCGICGGTYQVSKLHPIEGRCVVHTPAHERRSIGGRRYGKR